MATTPVTQTPPPVPNSFTTGITGQTGGPGYWYSPLFFKLPGWTEDVRKAFDGITELLKPLIQVQQLTLDALQPIADLLKREGDVFSNILQEVKNLVQQSLTNIIDLFRNTGVYVLIVLPDVIVKRYIWVPKKLIVNPKTGVVIAVQEGGMFPITDKQYAQYGKAQSAISNLPIVGAPIQSDVLKAKQGSNQRLITGKDASGNNIVIDISSGTDLSIFPVPGSNGMAGFTQKFNDSFVPLAQSFFGITEKGNRTDLGIPAFKSGDVVAGLSFMISAPGFTNFTDALFSFVNLFLPGSTLDRQFTKTRLSSVSLDDAILKSLKLRMSCTGPYINYKVGTVFKPNPSRQDTINTLDPTTCVVNLSILDIDVINALPFWKIEFYIRATNISQQNANPTGTMFEYAGAQQNSPADGFYKIADFFSESCQGFLQQTIKQGAQQNTQLLTRTYDSENRIKTFDHSSGGVGLTYTIPPRFYDYKFEFRVALRCLYNQKITPETLVASVLNKLNSKYLRSGKRPFSDYIRVGSSSQFKNLSFFDGIFGNPIESFVDLTNAQIILPLPFESNSVYQALLTTGIILGIVTNDTNKTATIKVSFQYLSDVQNISFNTIKSYFFDDPNVSFNTAIADPLFKGFVNEVYQYAKYGPNKTVNTFYVDQKTASTATKPPTPGSAVRATLASHLANFDHQYATVIREGATFEKIDEYNVVTYATKPIAPGSTVPVIATNPTRTTYNQLGLGVPAFRFDRWFGINVASLWPALFSFTELLKDVLTRLNLTYPPLQSPLLNFLNSILNELNSIIAVINDVINTLDSILGVLEVLAAELFHVLRIEDSIGKGYTTGGVDAIKNIILTSPGLPEYLKENIVSAANLTVGGISTQASLDMQANLTAQQRSLQTSSISVLQSIVDTNPSLSPILGVDQTIPIAQSIQASNSSAAFVANITILAGIPQIEDPQQEFDQLMAISQQVTQSVGIEVQKLPLEQSDEQIAIQLSQLDIQRVALQNIIDNGQNNPALIGDVTNAQNQLAKVNQQITDLTAQKIAVEAQINALQQKELGTTAVQNSPIISPNQLLSEQQLSSGIKQIFDFFENFITGVTPEEKKRQIDQFNSAVTITTPIG